MNPTPTFRLPRAGLLAFIALAALALGAAFWGGGNHASANVNPAGTDFYLDEEPACSGATPEITSDVFTAPLVEGSVHCYKVSTANAGVLGGLSQPTVGTLRITVSNLDEFVVTAVAAPGAACTFSHDSAANSLVQCDFPGPLAAGSQFTILVTGVTVDGDGSNSGCGLLGGTGFTAEDLSSAQGPISGQDQTSCWAIADFDVHMSKSLSPDPIYQTQTGTYTLTVDNDNTTSGLNSATVTDTIPSEFTIVGAITTSGGLGGSCGASGNLVTCTGVTLGPDAGVSDACPSLEADNMCISVPVEANANAGSYSCFLCPVNPVTGSDAVGNTANFSCSESGALVSTNQLVCNSGSPNWSWPDSSVTGSGDTFSGSSSSTITRVGTNPPSLSGAPIADGTDSCTFSTVGWDGTQLRGGPSNGTPVALGDWNISGTATGVVATPGGTAFSQQTLTVTATGAGTVIATLNWHHTSALAQAGNSQTPSESCTFAPVPITSATFNVAKDYIPTAAGPAVTVTLTCTTGTVTVNDATADETDTADFTVTNFTAGASCQATESASTGFEQIAGPDPLVDCGLTPGNAIPIADAGTSSCTITNRATVVGTLTALFPGFPAGGAIRHVDAVDAAAEDQTYHQGGGTLHPHGILNTIDDADNSTTSLHVVCLFANAFPGPLAGNVSIFQASDWIITTTATAQGAAGPPTTDNKSATVRDFDFNDDGIVDYRANCVEWRSAQPGSQSIILDVPLALEPPDKFYFDGPSPTGSQPLIKQWNFPVNTKIVGNAAGTSGASGVVGANNINANTPEMNDWAARDSSIWKRPNLDSSTVTVAGSAFTGLPNPGQPITRVLAPAVSFVDYTLGTHTSTNGLELYNGPLDGVQQRVAFSANSCGSVRVENTETGVVTTLLPGQSTPAFDTAGVLHSSDKGLGFTVLPTLNGQIPTNAANAACQPNESSSITITSQEDRQLRSDRIVLAPETITVTWVVGPGHGKQTDLAWVGQRKLLEHNWREIDGTCPWDNDGSFFVRYEMQQQSVGAMSTIIGESAVASGPDFVVVRVNTAPQTGVGNSDCISRVIAESEEPGEFDATAHVVESPSDTTVLSSETDFVIYYLKLEDVTVGLVPGARSGHNSGSLSPSLSGFTGADPVTGMVTNDTTDRTANVSADVLARVRVRGWAPLSNCPVRAQGVDSNGGVLPANRCVFPDDWQMKMGGSIANVTTPQADIWGNGNCGTTKEAGPFSLLDPTHNSIGDANVCNDSKAPHVNGGFRETVLGNGAVTNGDAPMQVSMISLTLTGSGFLRPAAKTDIYPANNNTFYVTHAPSDPWIDVGTNSNYFNHWNSWGKGANSGLYTFWTSLLAHGPQVISCPGAGSAPCAGGVNTGGYKTLSIYTDNHGEAMVWINGDADLTFSGCLSAASTLPTAPGTHGVGTGVAIKTITGNFCESGNTVGSSTLNAIADYPDKHDKHFALQSNTVTLTWTWGGTKTITVTPSAGNQINTVEFRATDRDGFCNPSPSLHPVFGEAVTFLIDSGDGTIIAVSNAGSIADHGQSAATTTARSATADVCVASVNILSTLFHEVNVFITAFDPEGTVQFDLTLNQDSDHDGVRDATDNCVNTFNPDQSDVDGDGIGDKCDTEGPSTSADCTDGKDNDGDGLIDAQDPGCAPPAPTLVSHIWGDIDCSGSVTIADAQKIARFLIGLTVTQASGCPAINVLISVTMNSDTRSLNWGDIDCNGRVSIGDPQKVARQLIDLPIAAGSAPCPGVFQTIQVPAP